LKIAKSIVASIVLAYFQAMSNVNYVQLAGKLLAEKKTRNNSTMNDNQDHWPEPVFSTLSAGLAWIFFNALILSAAFALTFFGGLVAASIGTFLYYSCSFITRILDNDR
jgi:hypothetical protein